MFYWKFWCVARFCNLFKFFKWLQIAQRITIVILILNAFLSKRFYIVLLQCNYSGSRFWLMKGLFDLLSAVACYQRKVMRWWTFFLCMTLIFKRDIRKNLMVGTNLGKKYIWFSDTILLKMLRKCCFFFGNAQKLSKNILSCIK